MKTSSISKNWKENIFLIACVCFFVLFVIIAAISGAWPGKDVSAQFFSAMAGALVAAIITITPVESTILGIINTFRSTG